MWSTRGAVTGKNRATSLRKQILGPLYPWPPQTALDPIYREKLSRDGYTVQPVAFESMPGFYCCADLYMPTSGAGKHPAIIRAHGHGATGRYGTQQQCAAMARMGAVVLSISMVGYNDCKQYCLEHTKEHPPGPAVASLQLLNLIRAADFLSTLPEVDIDNLHITGESGGGTQTFMLAAVVDDPHQNLDPGGDGFGGAHGMLMRERSGGACAGCDESRGDRRTAYAPKPQLIISDGKDWTKNVPVLEFPYIKHVYETLGAGDEVENVHLAAEGHDYGPSKRAAAYAFFLKHGVLSGKPNEEIVKDSDEALSVFNDKTPLPATALQSPQADSKTSWLTSSTPSGEGAPHDGPSSSGHPGPLG